jgi:hypothetical protein
MAETAKQDKWLNYLALTTVILAVCATLSTFKGGGFSTRAVLSQSQAANQWAYYQAKSLKGYIYEMQRDELTLALDGMGTKTAGPLADSYRTRIQAYGDKIKRYDEEKAQIEKEARRFETVMKDALEHSQSFGVAVIFLQIAILLSSIAALMKKKPVWFLGLAAGVTGVVYFANGFLTFF